MQETDSKANNFESGDRWKKKDIRDYSDADIEKLYEQWEEGDEDPLDPDELPEWKRPPPQIDLSRLDPEDPESMLRETKTGQTVMMFVTVSGSPTERETETITQLWQGSLFNAHYDVQRYIVASNRILLVVKDGAAAWAIKDFLVQQDRCQDVTIEGRDYTGRGSPYYVEPTKKKSLSTKAPTSSATKDKAKNEKKKKKTKSATGKREEL